MTGHGKTVWRAVCVLGVFAVLTTLHTWPLATRVSSHLSPSADARVNLWALNDMASQILTDPTRLFDGRTFYPYPRTLAFVDHQIANALVAAPLVAGGQDPITVYNVVLLATFILSGLCCAWLVVDLTGSVAAGLVAGSIFAFSGYRFHHFQHLHVLATHWLPLALLALHRFVREPSWPRAAGVTVTTMLVALSSWQLAVVGAFGLGVAAVFLLLSDDRPVGRRLATLVLIAALVGLALAPMASIYATASREWGRPGGETTGTRVDLSVRPSSFVTLPRDARTPYAPLLPQSDSRRSRFPGLVVLLLTLPSLGALLEASRGQGSVGRAKVLVGLGCLPLGVALVGVALGPRGSWLVESMRPLAPVVLFSATLLGSGVIVARRIRGCDQMPTAALTYAAVAVSGALLSLGPYVLVGSANLGPGVYWPDHLPPLSLLRAPERFTLLITLGVSVLAGIGVARLAQGREARVVWIGSTVTLVALTVDTLRGPVVLEPVPASTPEVYGWLADASEPGAVIEYPWSNHWSVYNNLSHGRRMVHGRGYVKPHTVRVLQDWPALTDDHLTQLWEHFRPRFIVLRAGLYPPDVRADVFRNVKGRPDALKLRARFGDDYVYELSDRGVGERLYRYWPREQLEHRRGFVVASRVTGARPGILPGLVVTLNGEPLLDRWGPEVTVASSSVIPFETAQLVPDLNVLQVRADYRLDTGEPGYPIASTDVTLAADVVVTAARDRATVAINNRVEQVDKGYFLAVLDPITGDITDRGMFNTSWYREDSDKLAAFIEDIPTGSPVVVASEFDVSRQLTPRAVRALKSLGLQEDLTGRLNWIHAAIGVKGARPGSASERVDRHLALVTLGERARLRVALQGLTLH